jgi:hypothetical protein
MTDHDSDLVNEYCRLAMAGITPADPRLVALRERMSPNEHSATGARLRAAAEADELERFMERKFGAND